MTDATTVQPDPLLEAYVLRVGVALGDVEPTERHALLADLRVHLEEVAQGDVRRLDDIVGPPEVYAEELRAAAGLTAPASAFVGPAGPAGSGSPTVGGAPAGYHSDGTGHDAAAAWPWVQHQLDRVVRTVARGWHDVADAVRDARGDGPAWWLLRAFLAVHALGTITPGEQGSVLIPKVVGERAWGLAAAFVCAVVSVRVGRDPDRVPLRVVRLANVAIVVVGTIALLQMDVA